MSIYYTFFFSISTSSIFLVFFCILILQVEVEVLFINAFSSDIDSYLWEEWKERHKDAPEEDLSALFSNLRFLPLAVLSADILMTLK